MPRQKSTPNYDYQSLELTSEKIPSALPKDQDTTMRDDRRFSRALLYHSIPHSTGHIYHHAGKDIFNYPPKFT